MEEYFEKRRETDVSYRSVCRTRSRIYLALKGETKSYSVLDILGMNVETYRKRFEFQMTPDMTGNIIESDHVKPVYFFGLSKDDELRKVFCWKNAQSLLKEIHQQKGIKINFSDYQLQFIKANQFIKLKEVGLNQDFY